MNPDILAFYNKAHNNVNKNYWLYQKLTRFYTIYISYFLSKFSLSPNVVTAMMLLPSFIGSYLFFLANSDLMLLGLFCFHIYFILDLVDGELARATNQSTRFGSYLDLVMHMITHPLIYISMSYYFFILEDNILILFLGFFAVCADFIRNGLRPITFLTFNEDIKTDSKFEKKVSVESNFNIVYFLSGFYRKHCFKFENAWFILIILYPVDFYLDYEVINLTLSAFSLCLFFILQITYTVKNLVINVKQNYRLEP